MSRLDEGRQRDAAVMELNPHAVEALIETLRDATETDDDRICLLLDLWEAMTGE